MFVAVLTSALSCCGVCVLRGVPWCDVQRLEMVILTALDPNGDAAKAVRKVLATGAHGESALSQASETVRSAVSSPVDETARGDTGRSEVCSYMQCGWIAAPTCCGCMCVRARVCVCWQANESVVSRDVSPSRLKSHALQDSPSRMPLALRRVAAAHTGSAADSPMSAASPRSFVGSRDASFHTAVGDGDGQGDDPSLRHGFESMGSKSWAASTAASNGVSSRTLPPGPARGTMGDGGEEGEETKGRTAETNGRAGIPPRPAAPAHAAVSMSSGQPFEAKKGRSIHSIGDLPWTTPTMFLSVAYATPLTSLCCGYCVTYRVV